MRVAIQTARIEVKRGAGVIITLAIITPALRAANRAAEDPHKGIGLNLRLKGQLLSLPRQAGDREAVIRLLNVLGHHPAGKTLVFAGGVGDQRHLLPIHHLRDGLAIDLCVTVLHRDGSVRDLLEVRSEGEGLPTLQRGNRVAIDTLLRLLIRRRLNGGRLTLALRHRPLHKVFIRGRVPRRQGHGVARHHLRILPRRDGLLAVRHLGRSPFHRDGAVRLGGVGKGKVRRRHRETIPTLQICRRLQVLLRRNDRTPAQAISFRHLRRFHHDHIPFVEVFLLGDLRPIQGHRERIRPRRRNRVNQPRTPDVRDAPTNGVRIQLGRCRRSQSLQFSP